MALAAMAPIAMASSVALANHSGSELVNASVGLSVASVAMVTDAAPTIASVVHARNRPVAAKNPVRTGETVFGR